MSCILVVDDDDGIRESIRFALETNGFTVVAVADGERALEVFSPERFDGAIVDLIMPGMSGLDVVEALRKRAPYLPIIVVSGALMHADGTMPYVLRIASALPHVSVLAKPFKLAELLRAVRAFTPAPAH